MTPDRSPSPPPNVEAQRPGETVEEYTARLVASLKEERRQKEEERRQKEEERRQKEEERRQREEERNKRLEEQLENQRMRESERQTARFVKLLQDELLTRNRELQEKTNESNLQALPAYLAQISRLQAHATRLLPRILPGTISAHVQRALESETGAGGRSKSSQPTTSGRTDITNKYYPLQLRQWHAFRDEVQRPGFAKVLAALRESRGLPSRSWIQNDEKTLLEKLPLLALNQKGGLNAARTDTFLDTVLLTPASRILNEYLSHARRDAKQVFFDHDVKSVTTVFESLSSLSSHSPRSPHSGSGEGVNNSIPLSVFPDCLVLYMDPVPTAEAPVQLIASAEHKPLHALRAVTVAQMMDGKVAEDLVIRLARQSLARLEKKRAKEQAEQEEQRRRAATSPSVPEVEVQPEADRASGSKTARVDRLTYFAYGLTQAFHYMFMAGLEFGYLANGEVLVFLRIPEDDATTLYYHVSLFPIPPDANSNDDNDNNSGSSGTQVPGPLTQMPYPASSDAVDEEALADLPIAQLVSFCEYALGAKRRSSSWTVEQTAKLAQFPNLPQDIAARYAQRPTSQLGRRRYDDGNSGGDRDGDDNNDGGDGGGGSRLGRLQVPYRNSHVRTASPLQQHTSAGNAGPADAASLDITTSFLSTACNLQTRPRPLHEIRPPTLPYCTHACLLGLVQNGPLDLQCPNVALHQAAGRLGSKDGSGNHHHPLTSLELARRVRDQLYDTPEVDCEYSVTHKGAVGYPFKLTLTGFGYTFVGKAVQHAHRRRLIHEAHIYKALQPLQGSVIPVHLGLIRLHVGYPVLSQFVQLPYMMLLSYAGASMLGALLHDDDDDGAGKDSEAARHRAEAARTQAELACWGFNDDDNNASNFRWCAETGRAMRIDFDRAYLVPSAGQLHVLTNALDVPTAAAHEKRSLRASQASSQSSGPTPTASSCTPLTPVNEAVLGDGASGPAEHGPQAKRQKTDKADGNAAAIETVT